MKKTFENNITQIYIVYAFVVILYNIMQFFVPINAPLQKHFPWLAQALIWCGVGLLVLDVVTKQHFWEKKFTPPLLVLLAVMMLSAISWIPYSNIPKTAKIILEQAVQMLVLFPLGRRMSWDAIRRFFKALYLAVSAVWVPGMVISFCQYAFAVCYRQGDWVQGLFGGRLSGLFSPPHFSMSTTVLLLCISVYYLLTVKKPWVRIWTAIEAVFCLIMLVLSQTRSALLALVATPFFCFGWYLYNRPTKKQISLFRKLCVSVGAALGVSILLLLLCLIMHTGLKQIPTAVIPQVKEELAVGESLSFPLKVGYRLATVLAPAGTGPVREIETVVLERKNMTENVMSNSRLRIWKEYAFAVGNNLHSLLLGYSPGSYMQLIKDRFPDLFIISHIRDNYPGMYADNLIYDTHSAYISVLATTGLAGVCVVLWFLLRCMMAVLRCEAERKTCDYYFLLAGVMIILITAGLDCDLFFRFSNTSVLFWLLAGVLLKRVGAFEEQDSQS